MRQDQILPIDSRAIDEWYEVVPVGGVLAIPAQRALHFRVRLGQSVTLRIDGATSCSPVLLRIEQDGTGGWTVTPNGDISGTPTISTVANAVTFVWFVYDEEDRIWEAIPWLTTYTAGLAYQPLSANLTTLAAVVPGATGLVVLATATAAGARSAIGVSGLSYVNTSVPGANTVANTATETAFDSKYTIPANSLAAGTILRLRMWGTYGTAALPVTLRGRFKIAGTTVLDTGELTAVLNLSNLGWTADIEIAVQTIGATASFEVQGFLQFATAATTGLSVNVINTSPVTVDTTGGLELKFTADWSGADAANTITLRILSVETVAP